MSKTYCIIKVGEMYIYNVHYIKGLFEKVEFTIDKDMASYYVFPDIRVNELIDYINDMLKCSCCIEIVEKDY